MPKPKIDRSILEAALVGFGHTLAQVTLKIEEIRQKLGGSGDSSSSGRRTGPGRISLAGRARIAAAQRKRWAAQKAMSESATPKKRKISAAARKRMSEATKKRWAEFRKNAQSQTAAKTKAAGKGGE